MTCTSAATGANGVAVLFDQYAAQVGGDRCGGERGGAAYVKLWQQELATP